MSILRVKMLKNEAKMCFFYNFIRFLGIYTLFLQPVIGNWVTKCHLLTVPTCANIIYVREHL